MTATDQRFAERQEKLRALLQQRDAATAPPEVSVPPVSSSPAYAPVDAGPIVMAFTDTKPEGVSASAFMEGLVAFANGWWAERRGCGCAVDCMVYADDVASIQTRPAPEPLTLDDLRAAYKRKEDA